MLKITKMQLWNSRLQVVDARAGPGMKSFTKFKTKNKKITGDKNEKPIKKKLTVAHFDREYSPGLSDKSEGPEDLDNDMDFLPEDGPSVNSSRNGSTGGSDSEEAIVVPEMKTRNRRRKGISKRLEEIRRPNVSGFIDLGYWTKETICCGAIFRGRNDEILLDYSHFKPCAGRLAMCRTNNKTTKGPETATVPVTTTSPGAVTSTTKGLYTSDSSSDSGYDDCSNQGYVGMSPPRQVPNPSADVTETDLTCHETIFSTAQEEEVAVHSDGDVIMTSETPTICAN
ncbi:hypothetical protein ABEB36_000481 [Hypothenemus hampei]|uniref:Uncharacterized protein n=1 Tax=Hypothenemus hampei TaxID=57062 RepID=A0ABD1FBC9_HYPHA